MRTRELKAARERLGLSQEALAKAIGFHRSAIARYETGMLPIPKVVTLTIEGLEPGTARTRKSA